MGASKLTFKNDKHHYYKDFDEWDH